MGKTVNKTVNIALTMGDPAGIGPEIIVRILADNRWRNRAEFTVYGAPEIIEFNRRKFAPQIELKVCETTALQMNDIQPGIASAQGGKAAYDTITRATLDALDGKVDAVVTAPMNKLAVNLAGIPFTGHTERIAELCGVKDFAMMQSAGDLRVAFVTTHIPLAGVPQACTGERIAVVAKLLHQACRQENIANPKLAAAAINPHAGENGWMGREDEEVVKPVLEKLRSQNICIDGPFPPDTMFIESVRRKYDGILSMYHDQGHIPFKMLAFDRGVNSTLGLPIIRTSPDHGTAYEIAYQGKADLGSMSAAIELAVIRAEHRRKQQGE